MVHAMPWSPNKDYQSLIRHHCPVWVEVTNFPNYMHEELPGLAASLGQVISPPCPIENRNRFCILWDTDIPTPPSIAVKVKGVNLGKKYFELKWGVFASACFACHKFGHLASECPMVLHQLQMPCHPRHGKRMRICKPRQQIQMEQRMQIQSIRRNHLQEKEKIKGKRR